MKGNVLPEILYVMNVLKHMKMVQQKEMTGRMSCCFIRNEYSMRMDLRKCYADKSEFGELKKMEFTY